MPDNDTPLTPPQLAVQTNLKQALNTAANEVLKLLLQDDATTEILTRPSESQDSLSERRGYLDNYEPQSRIPLQGIANDFYLLIDHIIQGAQAGDDDDGGITRPPSSDSDKENGQQPNESS